MTVQRFAEGLKPGVIDESQYALLFRTHPQPMWVYDLETLAFLAVNDAAVARYGYTETEFLRMTIKDIRPQVDVPRLLQNVENVTEGFSDSGMWRHATKSGVVLDVEISSHTLEFDGRRAELVMALDVTERIKSDLIRSNLQRAIASSQDVIFMTDSEGRMTFVNEAFERTYGYTRSEALGQNPRILKSGQHPREVYEHFWTTILAKRMLRGEIVNRTKDGRLLTVETTVDPIVSSNGDVTGFVAIQRDVTDRKQAETRLEDSELRFRQLAENIQEVFWITNPQKNEMLYVSPAYENIWGRTVESLYRVPSSWVDAIYPDDRDRVWTSAQTRQADGTYNEVYRIIRPDGTVRWIRDRAFPVKNERGEIYRITGLAADITEYVEAEKAKHESESRFRTLARTAPAAIFIYGDTFTYVNPAAVELTGYTEHELLGMRFWELVHPDHRELVRERGQKRLKGESVPSRYEFKIARKDGEVRWVMFSAGLYKPNGSASAIGTAFDITELKRIEEQLSNSERLYRDLVEKSNEVSYLLDRHLAILYVSPILEARTGFRPSDVLGKRILDLIHPDDVEGVRKDFRAVVNGGRVEPVEFRLKTKSEETLWVRASATPMMKAGKLDSIRGIAVDVTQRKLAEEALKVSEQRFRKLAETVSAVIVIAQGEKIIYANPAAEKIFGYSREELRAKKSWEMIHPEDQASARERAMRRQRGEAFENRSVVRVLTRDGGVRWLDYTAAIIDYDGHPALMGTAFDITERVQMEQRLVESQERYRELFNEALTGNYVSRPDGAIVACNRTFARIFGFDSPEEVMMKDAREFHASPEARARFLDHVAVKGKLEHFESDARRKDGTLINIIENVIGKFSEEGELVEIHGYVYDNTERKKLEDQIRQSQKMDSIGTLAGGIAHDFNNILGIILGYCQVIENSKNNPPALESGVAAIEKATQRGAALVRQLLTFARKSEVRLQPTNVNQTITEIAGLLEKTFPKTIEIRTAIDRDIPSVIVDPTQIHQVLLNLSVNARDAMPDGGTLTFSTSLRSGDRLPSAARLPAGVCVHISVTDTGIGMDDATRMRIFEPFFTTKEHGKGTGLGLATVFGIIESHKGFVEVESQPGRGTTFHLYLPAQAAGTESNEIILTTVKNAPGGVETILVVEDEEMLQELVSSALTVKGYSVLKASNGLEAEEVFTRQSPKPALVLTDYGLPKINGGSLLVQLQRIDPKVKVVVASGFLEPHIKADLLRNGAHSVIAKPYNPNEVLVKIREALDALPKASGEMQAKV